MVGMEKEKTLGGGDRYMPRQKTLQFHFVDPIEGNKKFVAVTVSQRRESTGNRRGTKDNGPVLPPTYYVLVEISTNLISEKLLYLHWAVSSEDAGRTTKASTCSGGTALSGLSWELPSRVIQPALPPGSFIWRNTSVRTPLIRKHRVVFTAIPLGQPHQCPAHLQFVLYSPHRDVWINNQTGDGGHNFVVPVRQIVSELQLQAVREHLLQNFSSPHDEEEATAINDVAIFCPSVPDVHHIFDIPSRSAQLDVAIWTTDEAVIIDILTNMCQALILHWGFLSPIIPACLDLSHVCELTTDRENQAWERPDPRLRPPDAVAYSNDPGAVETYFQRGLQGPESSIIQSVRLVFPYDVIFERCLANVLEHDQATEWYLPILKDSYLSATCGAFPQRLAFVLRSREKPDDWIHNECGGRSESCKFEVCPLDEAKADARAERVQNGHTIHHQKYDSTFDVMLGVERENGPDATQAHSSTPQSSYNSKCSKSQDFEISIPFSESFKQRLYQHLQRASARADIHQRFRHAEFCSEAADTLSQPPSACLREIISGAQVTTGSNAGPCKRKVIRPLFSCPQNKSDWMAEEIGVRRSSVSLSVNPHQTPLLGGLQTIIAPPPLPGTVLYHHSYTLNDSSGRGVAHVLAIEDTAQRHEWQGELLTVVRVHILVSISVPCIVHWGLLSDKRGSQWIRPDRSLWPEGTEAYDAYSVDSPMKTDPRTRMCRLELSLPQTTRGSSLGIAFVLRDVMTDRWITDVSGQDLFVRTRRDRTPEFWARPWRGPHANLIATLLQEELRLDTTPTPASQRYLALQRSVTLYGVDRSDVEYWAWIYVWWRFAHLRIFDWQKHAHSRPWEIGELADSVSLNITSQWRAATRSRPIIKLLLRHVLCPTPDEDIRKELHAILARSNLLSIPFYDQWYRKVYREVGVEDYVICRGLIHMLRTLNVASYHEVLKHYACSPTIIDDEGPCIPPSFAFLQSQLSHFASTRAKQEDSPVSGDGDTCVTATSTDFITRHIDLQTTRLRLLVNALEEFGYKLQTLFFGPTIEIAIASTRDSITVNMKGVLKEILDLRKALRPSCPKISSRMSRRHLLRELSIYSRLVTLSSRARTLAAPVVTHCTDNKIVRDFIYIDHALDSVQQEALARILAFSGHPIRVYDEIFNFCVIRCPTCEGKHQSWNEPLALMLPWRRVSDGSLIFNCREYALGCVVQLSLIIGGLLPGLKSLHSSSEEANVLLNDWSSLIAQVTTTSHISLPNAHLSLDPKVIVDGLLTGEIKSDFLFLLAAFMRRVERCASRILNLSLIYLSDKVKFLYDCLDESEMIYTLDTNAAKLESLPYPPSFPKAFDGTSPFLDLLPVAELGVPQVPAAGVKRITKDVNAFIKGIIQNSDLFWIANIMDRLKPLLRSLTFVPAWHALSETRHAAGSIVIVDSLADLRPSADPSKSIEAFYRPVILLVRSATGNEVLPYNTAGIITGPTNVERKGYLLSLSPHILSPLALQARQWSVMALTSLDESDFESFIKSIRSLNLGQGDTAEFILPENSSTIIVHPLSYSNSAVTSSENCSSSQSEASTTCTSIKNLSSSSSSSCCSTVGDAAEEDAILIRSILSCLSNPRKVSRLLPPQTGPLLPTLHYFCPSCPTELRLQALPEDTLSADSFSGATDSPYLRHDNSVSSELCWGAWYSSPAQHFPIFKHIPPMSTTLFEKLYGTSRWFLSPKEFTPLVVGSRGMGIQLLRNIFRTDENSRLDVTVPTLAVPFGAFPSTLRDPENHALAEKLHSLLLSLKRLHECLFNPSAAENMWMSPIHREDSSASMGSHLSAGRSAVSSISGSDTRTGTTTEVSRLIETRRGERLLRECRSIVRSLKPTRECLNALTDLAENALPNDDLDKKLIGMAIKEDKMKLWAAVKKVWCSSFTPALLLATRVTKLPFDLPIFAVIIQLMEPVAYSFSLSMTRPSYNSSNQESFTELFPPIDGPVVYGEVTSGLPMAKGELYNGGYVTSGIPLSFRSHDKESVEVLCFSSQSYVLKPRKCGLVLRPDCNIQGIGQVMPSGGLVCACLDTPTRSRYEYQKDPLFSEPLWRNDLLRTLSAICREVHARKSADDPHTLAPLAIEGVIDFTATSPDASEHTQIPMESDSGDSPARSRHLRTDISKQRKEDDIASTRAHIADCETYTSPSHDTATLFSIPTSHLRVRTVALENHLYDSNISSYAENACGHRISLISAIVTSSG